MSWLYSTLPERGKWISVLCILVIAGAGLLIQSSHAAISAAKEVSPVSTVERVWSETYPSRDLHGADISIHNAELKIESDETDGNSWVRAYRSADTAEDPQLREWVEDKLLDIEEKNGRLVVEDAPHDSDGAFATWPRSCQMMVLIHLPRSLGINVIRSLGDSKVGLDWHKTAGTGPSRVTLSSAAVLDRVHALPLNDSLDRIEASFKSGQVRTRLNRVPADGATLNMKSGRLTTQLPEFPNLVGAEQIGSRNSRLSRPSEPAKPFMRWANPFGKGGPRVELEAVNGNLRLLPLKLPGNFDPGSAL